MRYGWAILLVVVSGCGSGSESACDRLRSCCDQLTGGSASACRADVAQASSSGQCAAALASLRQAGGCSSGVGVGVPPDGGTGGGGTGGGGNSSSAQSAICAHYVSCATATAPAGAAAILDAYGPSGSCWQSTVAVADDCDNACALGLMQLRGSNAACGCIADGECGGATPACDTGSGRCVACNGDAQCAGGATPYCNVASHTCVVCTEDAQCGGSTPACATASGTCVACTSNAQCSGATPACSAEQCVQCVQDADCSDPATPHCGDSHTCVQCAGLLADYQCSSGLCLDGTCCVPHGCSAGFACGTDSDGCGHTISCGACAYGTCNGHSCDTVGLSCDPSASICAPGEGCMFDVDARAYRCSPTTPLTDSCISTDPGCNTWGQGTEVDTYGCPNGHCVPYCASAADCANGTHCSPVVTPTAPPSPSNWGYCL